MLLLLALASIVGHAQTQIDLTTQVQGILLPNNFANSSLANTTVLFQNYYQGAYSSTIPYTQGQMVSQTGTTYVSLINGNQNNTPNLSPSAWASIGGGGGGGNIAGSCSLTPSTIPIATGTAAICNSNLTDISGVLSYGGSNVTVPLLTITASVGNYINLSSTGPHSIPTLNIVSTTINQGTTVDASGVYTEGVVIGGYGQFGDFLASGNVTIGELQNGTPGQPIVVNQNGGGNLAMQFNGGISISGGLYLSNGFGSSGQVPVSGGSGGPAAWGAGGGGGSMVYPGAGVPNSSGSAWLTSYAVGTAANDLVQLDGSGALPAVSGASLTSLAAANLTGTASVNTTGTAGGLSGCSPSTAGSLCYWNGSAWTLFAGNNSGTLYLQENGSGAPAWVASTTVYPGAGVANSTGSAWGTSYTVGTSSNNLVQLNVNSQLPAVSGVNLTNLTAANLTGTASINTTGKSGGLTGCSPVSAGSLCYWNGSVWALLVGNTSGTTQTLTSSAAGVLSWAAGGGGSFTYPAAGVACSTGSAWCASYGVGTGANNLVQLNGAGALPAVSGSNLTNLSAANLTGTASVNTTGTAGGLSALTVPIQTTIASAATIAPGGVGGTLFVTGSATVTTITVPSGCTSTTASCIYELIPTNGFNFGPGGNINIPGAVTVPVSLPVFVTWNQNAGSWYLAAIGNVTSGTSLLTGNSLLVASGTGYSVASSLITDNGTSMGYSGAGGLNLTNGGGITLSGGTQPAHMSVACGTGSISPGLLAGSAGFVAPPCGGTSYVIQPPATISAGVMALAPAASMYSANVAGMYVEHIPHEFSSFAQTGSFGPNVQVAGFKATNSGTLTNLHLAYGGPSCTTGEAYSFNVAGANVGTPATTHLAYDAPGTTVDIPQTGITFTAGQQVSIVTSTQGNCSGYVLVTGTYIDP